MNWPRPHFRPLTTRFSSTSKAIRFGTLAALIVTPSLVSQLANGQAPAPSTQAPLATVQAPTPESPKAAEAARPPESPAPTPAPATSPTYSLVSQGGIAMGSWQAGLAYYLTEWRKKQSKGEAPGFSIVAGASAGAVNGLMVALGSCQKDYVGPEKSLFYRIWVESLGLWNPGKKPGLFPSCSTEKNPLGLFDQRAIRDVAFGEAKVDLANTALYRTGCYVDAAFSTTHLRGTSLPVYFDSDGASLLERKSLRKRFALRIEASANAALPATNLFTAQSSNPRLRPDRPYYADLGHRSDGKVDVQRLLDVVQASGAFPLAFPPVDLPYVEHSIDGSRTSSTSTFIDGGTFNNTPINLAIDLNKWKTAKGQQAGPVRYIFLEPNITQWDVNHRRSNSPDHKCKTHSENILGTALGFFGPFLGSAKDAEYFDTTQRHPFLRGPGANEISEDSGEDELALPIRQMPIIGAELGAFFAFLERDFRVYDFYVGMADAHHFLKQQVRWGDSSTLDILDTGLKSENPRYARIRSHYVRMKVGGTYIAEKHGSVNQRDKNYIALIAAMEQYKRWLIGHPEAGGRQRQNAFLRTLAGEQADKLQSALTCETSFSPPEGTTFTYVDLPSEYGNRSLSACDSKAMLRKLGHSAATHLAESQPGKIGSLIRIAQRPALDLALGVKLWPPYIFGFGFGRGPELFLGATLYKGLRADLGMRLSRLGPGFRPDSVTQSRWSSDAYFRLLQQAPLPPTLDLVSLDPFVGGFVGQSNHGPFGGALGGLRISVLDRLSIGGEVRHVWAPKNPSRRWWEGNLFITWQLFPGQ